MDKYGLHRLDVFEFRFRWGRALLFGFNVLTCDSCSNGKGAPIRVLRQTGVRSRPCAIKARIEIIAGMAMASPCHTLHDGSKQG
eukprot:101778-Amphidinium_carterae.1